MEKEIEELIEILFRIEHEFNEAKIMLKEIQDYLGMKAENPKEEISYIQSSSENENFPF